MTVQPQEGEGALVALLGEGVGDRGCEACEPVELERGRWEEEARRGLALGDGEALACDEARRAGECSEAGLSNNTRVSEGARERASEREGDE